MDKHVDWNQRDAEADRRAVHLARQQRGLISTRQAIGLGMTLPAVLQRGRQGSWTAAHRGVWVVGGAPDTYEQRLMARLLFCGPDAVASHASAAKLWGIPGFDERIEWTRPRGRSQRRPYGWCHGSLWLPPGHVTEHKAIPVTTPARTIFDLAGVVHPRAPSLSPVAWWGFGVGGPP